MSRLGVGDAYCDWCQLALIWRNDRWETTVGGVEYLDVWNCPARDDELPHEPESTPEG